MNQTIAGKAIENNNQTIKVDDNLTFTWSSDILPKSKLFGLVPVDKEDSLVKVLTGHFELNLTNSGIELKESDSVRFCV